MRQRVGAWLRRYLPAEILSVFAALLVADVAWQVSGNPAVASVAGAWGETATYYVTMFSRDLARNPGELLVTTRDLILEFGPTEALDSFVLRPALMYTAGRLLADVSLGVIVGKLIADVVFYIPTITSYELLRRGRPFAMG
jgi:hypothetical protein